MWRAHRQIGVSGWFMPCDDRDFTACLREESVDAEAYYPHCYADFVKKRPDCKSINTG
jgi:hypothetical protein